MMDNQPPKQMTAETAGRGQCVLHASAGDLQDPWKWRYSKMTRVRGLCWRIAAHRGADNNLELKLCCSDDAVESWGKWSCLASASARIKVGQQGEEDKQQQQQQQNTEYNMPSHMFFAEYEEINSGDRLLCGQSKEALLKTNFCWNAIEKDKSVTIEADIHVDPPLGVIALPKLDLLIINGQPIKVNKELLALHSPYFKTLFFNPNFREGAADNNEFKLQIADPPAGVHHFERLVALMHPLMYPEYKPINDDYVEGVLHLANEYQIEVVEGICLNFLCKSSKKSALFKYRLAEKYGYSVLKAHVLRNLTKEDFAWDKFKTNVHECFALGGDNDAFQALLRRYDEL